MPFQKCPQGIAVNSCEIHIKKQTSLLKCMAWIKQTGNKQQPLVRHERSKEPEG